MSAVKDTRLFMFHPGAGFLAVVLDAVKIIKLYYDDTSHNVRVAHLYYLVGEEEQRHHPH